MKNPNLLEERKYSGSLIKSGESNKMNVQSGNERFQCLVDLVYRNNFLFPFSTDKTGRRAVTEICRRFLEEKSLGQSAMVDLLEECLFFEDAEQNMDMQKVLGLKKPQIIDYSELLGLRRGRVYGLEFQKIGPTGSHKDLMIGALIVLQVMAGVLPHNGVDMITDAGFFNSALAAKLYTKLFGFKGIYFIQETVPEWLLEQLDDDHFEAVRVAVPDLSTGIDKKNATYLTLLRRFIVDKDFRGQACYLGHAEIGHFVMMPYGRMFARLLEKMSIRPSVFVTPVGAGTTFLGIGGPLQEYFDLDLVLCEYAGFTPLKAKIFDDRYKGEVDVEFPGVPLSLKSNAKTDEKLLQYLREKGYDIGLTSATSLTIATYLAEKRGVVVVVPIFERFRDYSKNARKVISREIQLNPFILESDWAKVSEVYALC